MSEIWSGAQATTAEALAQLSAALQAWALQRPEATVIQALACHPQGRKRAMAVPPLLRNFLAKRVRTRIAIERCKMRELRFKHPGDALRRQHAHATHTRFGKLSQQPEQWKSSWMPRV